MNILFLSGWFPYPPDNGSKIRIYNLLKGLANRHQVTLLAFYRTPDIKDRVQVLQTICRKVEVVPWKEFNPGGIPAMMGFVSVRPRSVVDTFSPQMQRLIEIELSAGSRYDVVIASELTMAVYQKSFRGYPALLEDIELAAIYDAFIQTAYPFHRLRHGLTWLKTRRYVAGLLRGFETCTVVSDIEREILSRIAPAFRPVEIIPNCLDVRNYEGIEAQPEPGTLIFTGSLAYSANYDAVCFFLRDIYSLIKKAVPDVTFCVTGRTDGIRLPADVGNTSVDFTGYVDDVKPLIANSWASVVPLRAGGGTRLKILEALALGTPVVTTSKGAEGLDVCHGEHLLIADDPAGFAACVVDLLRDVGLRAKLAANGKRLVEEKYDWAAVMPRFLSLVERVAGGESISMTSNAVAETGTT
jgi:glycosyltransferase involved in cell wall biosynthesis